MTKPCPYCKGAGQIDEDDLAGQMLAFRAHWGLGTRGAAKIAGLTSYSSWGRAERGLTVSAQTI